MHSEEMSEFELVALGKSNSHTSPLFCLPGAGGELWVFRQVASLVSDDQPIYGIELKRFFSTERNFSVEQIADVCLSALRQAQPRGPYHLCGYSFGALVAYEVANRLSRDGENIGVLALIDTGNPAFRVQLSSAESTQLQKTYVANRLGKYWRLLTSANIGTIANNFLAHLAARAGLRTRRLVRNVCRAMNRPMPKVFRENDRALFDAWRAYNPPSSVLPILLLYEPHRCAEYGGDRTLGWRLCTSGEIDVEFGLGAHVEMMKAENLGGFVAKLSGRLKSNATSMRQ